VRHPLVQKIVLAYDRRDAQMRERPQGGAAPRSESPEESGGAQSSVSVLVDATSKSAGKP
jgi:hypothetical protein